MSLMKFRNGVIHGQPTEEAKLQEFKDLREAVQAAYASYQFTYFFTRKTVDERAPMDRDSMSSSLHSMDATKAYQQAFR
jgi:hypothetical protein